MDTKKVAVNISRILLGMCFVFSGFVKAIDPSGFAYKISDYLEAFHLTFFSGLSWIFAVLLAAFEFFLGTSLILGIWKKLTSALSLMFLLVMTPFTLYLAIKNPVSDCGCFGDALILTNWQTFYKNMVLLLLAFPVFHWNGLCYKLFGWYTARWTAYWCLIFPVLLSAYSYFHLPLLDFRPYQIGNRLADFMTIPDGAPLDSFDTRFIYEKNGVQQEFSAEKAPLNDASWTFVDRKEIQIRKGYTPPIHDFVLEHPMKGDITEDVLKDTSYTFLLVSPDLEKSNRSANVHIESARQYAGNHGYEFYGLTNSGADAIDEWNYEYDSDIEYCSVDERTLQTMIRSNPGMILLKDGVVLQKWGSRDIPDFSKTKQPLNALPWGKVRKVSTFRVVFNVFILFMIPVLLFFLLHRGYRFHFHLKKIKNKKTNIT
ncbi:MAG: BT_3928 family protein [Bacteroidales bacterium]|nr:DoxX family protein [Bacteroidales bacterium]